MGRGARGVRGMTLQATQKVVSLIVVDNDQMDILTATIHGYGKRTAVTEYRFSKRGAQGVISIQTSDRNGKVVGASLVNSEDEIMLITDKGVLVRTRVDEISQMGRNTQGVKLISLGEDERLVSIEKIESLDQDENGNEQKG